MIILQSDVFIHVHHSEQIVQKKLKIFLRKLRPVGCSHICIMGDFNFKEIDWLKQETTVSYNHPANMFLNVENYNFLNITCNTIQK